MWFAWLSSVILPVIIILPAIIALVVLPILTLVRCGRRPILRILPDHGGVVLGRRVVEIHLHGR
jgi:hypothetical protein